MKFKREHCILYGVTDRKWLKGESLCSQVEKALKGGATMIQLREKTLGGEEFRREALQIQKLCGEYGVPFLINDNVMLACEIDADGVHVGQKDMSVSDARRLLGPGKIIGATAKTVEQAVRAQAEGADYLGSGAVFGTETKGDAVRMDHELLDKICESVKIPVVAIGGISRENILELKGRKMAGMAVVSGIFGCDDIEKGTAELKKLALEVLKIPDSFLSVY